MTENNNHRTDAVKDIPTKEINEDDIQNYDLDETVFSIREVAQMTQAATIDTLADIGSKVSELKMINTLVSALDSNGETSGAVDDILGILLKYLESRFNYYKGEAPTTIAVLYALERKRSGGSVVKKVEVQETDSND